MRFYKNAFKIWKFVKAFGLFKKYELSNKLFSFTTEFFNYEQLLAFCKKNDVKLFPQLLFPFETPN